LAVFSTDLAPASGTGYKPCSVITATPEPPMPPQSPEPPAYPHGIAFIEGRYVAMEEAKISVLDWGFLRSDATYDVVHVWKGRFFRMDKHLDRFLASIAKLRMELPFGREDLVDILRQCVIRSGHDDAYVEMILTRGLSPTFSRDPRDARNTFIAFAIPFGWILPPQRHDTGMSLIVARNTHRIAPDAVDPTVKNYHWLDLVGGLFEAYERGGENVLLCDGTGNIAEGPGFNIFAVKDGVATTPRRGVLEGITRMTAIELCRELAIPVSEADIPAGSLSAADEAFVTSTAGGIISVSRVDGAVIGDGTPGPLTRKLTRLYWQKHDDPAWTTAVQPANGPA